MYKISLVISLILLIIAVGAYIIIDEPKKTVFSDEVWNFSNQKYIANMHFPSMLFVHTATGKIANLEVDDNGVIKTVLVLLEDGTTKLVNMPKPENLQSALYSYIKFNTDGTSSKKNYSLLNELEQMKLNQNVYIEYYDDLNNNAERYIKNFVIYENY